MIDFQVQSRNVSNTKFRKYIAITGLNSYTSLIFFCDQIDHFDRFKPYGWIPVRNT